MVPRRGEKKGLLDLAARNASLAYDVRFNAQTVANYEALETLRAVLALPALPRRIDCFDISTIQGSETVASMVVCEDGRMRKSEYKKFRIRSEGDGRFLDDFAAMHQVVQRRYRRVLEDGGPFPDLIVIDGGKGQLTAAYEALESLGLSNLVAIGLAKQEELIFTRDHDEPIALPTSDPALLSAAAHSRRGAPLRGRVPSDRARPARRSRSELDAIPGVGARTRNALLRRFGSLAGVRRATREELESEVGPKLADAILRFFSASGCTRCDCALQ